MKPAAWDDDEHGELVDGDHPTGCAWSASSPSASPVASTCTAVNMACMPDAFFFYLSLASPRKALAGREDDEHGELVDGIHPDWLCVERLIAQRNTVSTGHQYLIKCALPGPAGTAVLYGLEQPCLQVRGEHASVCSSCACAARLLQASAVLHLQRPAT